VRFIGPGCRAWRTTWRQTRAGSRWVTERERERERERETETDRELTQKAAVLME
jgi:hypothetical protein